MKRKTNKEFSIKKEIKLTFNMNDIVEIFDSLNDEQVAEIISEFVDNRNVLYLVACIQHKKINREFEHDNKTRPLDYNDPEMIKEYDEQRREQAVWKEIKEIYQELTQVI